MKNVDEVGDRVSCNDSTLDVVIAGFVLTTMCNASLTSAQFADCTLVFSIPVTVGQQQQPALVIAMAPAYLISVIVAKILVIR